MTLRINIFGKQGCSLCEQTQKKIHHFLKKWELENTVEVVYWDTTTVDGDAEASFYNVNEIPTTVIEKDSEELLRWDGPSSNMQSDDVHQVLTEAGAPV